MQGLVFWAHSYCRSVLGFYKGLADAWKVPAKICIWIDHPTFRTKTGFSEDEFAGLDITFIGDDYELAKSILNNHKDWHQFFAAYQTVNLYKRLLLDARNLNCHIAIGSEAPCNMNSGWKRCLKELYLKYVLPKSVHKQIIAADYILNYSGDDNALLLNLGWTKDKIISCGYYSPPIIGSKCIRRTEQHWKNFRILLTGLHQWHRSPWLLLEALHILDQKGLKYECDITQKGELYEDMKRYIEKHKMQHVHLLGFLPLEDLISKYENCSVYVGTGNHEPWGIRLNDALSCGSPLVVNRGMGGHKIIIDYKCGLIFERNDATGLATALERLILDKEYYLSIANASYQAAGMIDPQNKAVEIKNIISEKFENWN